MRRELKKQVKGIVNDFGPKLFENFDKLRLVAKEGSKPNSKPGSKSTTPFKNRSRAASKGDLLGGDLDLDYKDQLEMERAFACLTELENI